MLMKPKDHDHDETAPAGRFSRLSLCKKRDKENQFPMTSSVCLYSNISWATANHSARSIHYVV